MGVKENNHPLAQKRQWSALAMAQVDFLNHDLTNEQFSLLEEVLRHRENVDNFSATEYLASGKNYNASGAEK